jgi:hypothetical protein
MTSEKVRKSRRTIWYLLAVVVPSESKISFWILYYSYYDVWCLGFFMQQIKHEKKNAIPFTWTCKSSSVFCLGGHDEKSTNRSRWTRRTRERFVYTTCVWSKSTNHWRQQKSSIHASLYTRTEDAVRCFGTHTHVCVCEQTWNGERSGNVNKFWQTKRRTNMIYIYTIQKRLTLKWNIYTRTYFFSCLIQHPS